MTASWLFPPTAPTRVQGRGLAEDNFAQEARSSLEILIREALQNPLDARGATNNGPVRVSLRLLSGTEFNSGLLHDLINQDYISRLEASLGDKPEIDFANPQVLLLEDYGTTGLLGEFEDSTIDGNKENWNAFWFREGEGAKPGPGSNGRAGQGKITYYRMSAARALFGVTRRESDGRRLLMGRSSFRRMYIHNKTKYERDGFWCVEQDGVPLPEQKDKTINEFCSAFKIARANEPGLSLVLPYPIDFEKNDSIRTVIAEFYYPIARGRLEVSVDGIDINPSTIDALAESYFPDDQARKRGSSFTRDFRSFVKSAIEDEKKGSTPIPLAPGWEKRPSLVEKDFDAQHLANLRNDFEEGKKISVRFPISVRPKKGAPTPTFFDVHLAVPDELDRAEEAYIRRDLLIGSELHLESSTYLQKARGITIVDDGPLSAFLADAEEPTHLKWNASRPRLAEDYSSPKDVVRAVRQAMPRLLAFLSGSTVKRDVKALAKYFTKLNEETGKYTAGGKATGKKDPNTTNPPPTPKPKLLRLSTGPNWVRVLPNGSAGPSSVALPLACLLEVAYEGLDQDAFRAYDPFDFDLADASAHPIEAQGVTVNSHKRNRVEFSVNEPTFSIQVGGFDSNIRLRARVTYMESADGSTVDAE